MGNLVNGGTTLKPGLPRVELSPTPALFEKFGRLDPVDQGEVLEVLKRIARGKSFNDSLSEVRPGPDTVAPKAWRDL